MMPDKAQALILDFGGVVSRTLFETHPETERALGLPPGSLTWRGPFDPDSDLLWQEMQSDKITERDYWAIRTKEIAKITGNNWSGMSDFVQAARGADPNSIIRPEAYEAISLVEQAGMKLAILSNELDLFYGAELRRKLKFLSKFDAIIDATYTKILKPDPEAYALCLDQLGLPASACVFVDDQMRNILGAQAVGLNTIHFDVQNPQRSYNQALSKLVGLCQENPHEIS